MRRLLTIAVLILIAAAFAAAQVPKSNHVFVIVEENHPYSSVVGNTTMPYTNGLIAKGAVATNYYANTHPSIGNYFEMTMGQIYTNNDSYMTTVTADNMVRHLMTAGKTWKSYAEGLPYAGYTGGDTGYYFRHHNPFSYFSDVVNSSSEKLNLVGFPQFLTDLANHQLPNFSYIVPNIMDDAHNGTLAQADSWLSQYVPKILASPEFQQDGILIITFDESYDTDTANGGGHVFTMMLGPGVKAGYKSPNFYQHQSLLKTAMTALGATTFPGAAATAPAMADMFGTGTSPSPSATSTTAGVTITSPTNGSTVSSPTTIKASATATSGRYITAMRVYIDGVSAYTVNAGSLSYSATMSAGSHKIGVNAWDNTGAVYVSSVGVTVGSTSTTTTTSSTTGVTIASPTNGATVSSPTTVAASATATSGRYITAMRVYLDGVSMYTVNAGSLSYSCTMSAGSHTITVNAWDNTGAVYVKAVSVTAGSTAPAPAPSPTPTTTGVTIASPTNGATVNSPTTVSAAAAATSGRYITAMRVYLDSVSAYTVNASSLNYSATLAAGSHTITVNAWDNTGAVYVKAVSVTVGTSTAPAPSPSPSPTPVPSTGFDSYPSTANVMSNLQNATWDSCNCGGTGSTPSSQSLTKTSSGDAVDVKGNGSGIAGWLWYSPFASTNSTNWIMDYNVTPTSMAGAVGLEFDGNQTGSLGNFVFGTECNYGYNPSRNTVWRFWTMSGGSQTWGTTAFACPIKQVGHTYHVQVHFVATTGSYKVARLKVTDLTAGTVVEDDYNLGTFSAVGSHGSSIDIQLDVAAGGNFAVNYNNINIIRW